MRGYGGSVAEKQEWHTTNLHANYPLRFHEVMVANTLQCKKI